MCWETKKLMSAVPSLFGTRDRFHGRQFFPGSGIGRVGGVGGGWFGDDPRTSLVAQMVKHQPAVQETWVGQILGIYGQCHTANKQQDLGLNLGRMAVSYYCAVLSDIYMRQ